MICLKLFDAKWMQFNEAVKDVLCGIQKPSAALQYSDVWLI